MRLNPSLGKDNTIIYCLTFSSFSDTDMKNRLFDLIQGCEVTNISGTACTTIKTSHYNTTDFIHRIIESKSITDINQVCSLIARHYGFDFSTTFVRLHRLHSTPLCFFMREYQNEWTNHYEKNEFVFNDPSIRMATSNITPFVWSSSLFNNVKTQLIANELEVTYDAMDFGLRDVFNAPFHGPNGEYGLVRFISTKRGQLTDNDRRQTHFKIPELYFLSSQIYETLSSILRNNEWRNVLSQREKDILKWTAKGKNPANISDQLHVSENTVRKHLSNIRDKLHVRSTTHAVAKAISSAEIYL